MSAKTVGFAIADEDRDELESLVEYFADGNRSEFLRVAMKRMRHEMWAAKMADLQSRGRADTGGKVYTPQEVVAMCRNSMVAA
jgi:Arc/MetJ-type ribon-helix-helix transcriptional regulator